MSILSALKNCFKSSPPPDPVVLAALQRACAIVEPAMNNVPFLEKKLGPVLERTVAHCHRVVDDLPGVFEVDRAAFSSSSLVHALFPTVDDIALMLGKSQSMRDYLVSGDAQGTEFIFAMLAARWQRKKSYGAAYDGEIFQSDALIEYLYFTDHVLVGPANSLESARDVLFQVALESLLKTFRSTLTAKRAERESLQESREQARDQINVMRSLGRADKFEEASLRLQQIDEQLRQNIEDLQPERIASALAEFLAQPEKSLHLEKMQVTVDRSGMVAREQAASGNGTNEALDFAQIVGRDRRRYVGLLVRIRRSDAQEAVEQLKDMQQRYFLL